MRSITKYRIFQMTRRRRAVMSAVMLLAILAQTWMPLPLLALTSGPQQPEFQSIQAVPSSELVDLFTGDLNYSIPLMELPGPGGSYPFTLSYRSGITVDQEASWVGLGWSLGAGAITRSMRGLPDDFDGDLITVRSDAKPNVTWDFSLAALRDMEVIGVPITEGVADTALREAANLGIRFSHNSYLGWDAGLDLGLQTAPLVSSPLRFGVGLSTSAIHGADVNLNANLGSFKSKIMSGFHTGFGMNSREGLMSLHLGVNKTVTTAKGRSGTGEVVGYSLSFEKQAFIPQITERYVGSSFSGTVEVGGIPGIPLHLGGRVNVGYAAQQLANRNLDVRYPTVGFFYSKARAGREHSIQDFNRHDDGALHPFSAQLSVPNSTPDVFHVTGAAMSTTFRAYRDDVGMFTDPVVASAYSGASAGVDLNFLTYADVGLTFGANVAESKSSLWDYGVSALDSFAFKTRLDTPLSRQTYFKAVGNAGANAFNSYDYLHNNDVSRVDLNGLDIAHPASMRSSDGQVRTIDKARRDARERTSNSIQYYLTKEIVNSGDRLGEFQMVNGQILDRSADSLHHIGGFDVVHTNGLRYVYALPVMNLAHHEYVYSVEGQSGCVKEMPSALTANLNAHASVAHSDQFLQVRKIPAYAHSYLLTAVLGHDYQDIDEIPGPSDGDLGYWVRFAYDQTDDYAWRAPYEKDNYLKGSETTSRDDLASFMWGVREQYYLSEAMTRTHRVEFITENRHDAIGASNTPFGGQSFTKSKRLRAMRLFSRIGTGTGSSASDALKRIDFQHDYGVAGALLNNENDSTRLFLRSLTFNSYTSNLGRTHPYKFEYHHPSGTTAGLADYNPLHQDNWGRPQLSEDSCYTMDFPQVDQTREETLRNDEVSLWHLSKITLPSGLVTEIAYESDSYAYVQDRAVMELIPIAGVNGDGNATIEMREMTGSAKLVLGHAGIQSAEDLSNCLRDIHGLRVHQDGSVVPGSGQVFYKVFSHIIDDDIGDFIEGYAYVDSFTYQNDEAILYLTPYRLRGAKYHPFAAAAWTKLRYEYPHLLADSDFEDDPSSFRNGIGRFVASFKEISALFREFYKICSERGYGSSIDLARSAIRLNTVSTEKFGGDVRVRSVRIADSDAWDPGVIYGQDYSYTIEEDGQIITSGVATNEPAVGYDACALQSARVFHDRMPIRSSQRFMVELPANKAYLPGASVGYRQVTVQSLATSELVAGGHHGATGKTVHQFYTAKEFPILHEATPLEANRLQGPKFFSLLGITQRCEAYAGSQGFGIELNDMHGKAKEVFHYGLNKNHQFHQTPQTRTVYTYHEGAVRVINENGVLRQARTLANAVDVLLDYRAPGGLNVETREIGVDREMVLDLRETSTQHASSAMGLNVQFTPTPAILFPIPLSGAFPSLSRSSELTRTVVANKIIRRSGILKRIDVYDGQAHVRTDNLVYDLYEGQAVLTSVNNFFDDRIYTLNIPAHLAYTGMSSAASTYRATFTAQLSGTAACNGYRSLSVPAEAEDLIAVGDVYLVRTAGNYGMLTIVAQGSDGTPYAEVENLPLGVTDYELVLVRPGRKNLLSASAGSISALANPLNNPTRVVENLSGVPNVSGSVSIATYGIDSVLNATAVTYEHVWPRQLSTCALDTTGGGNGAPTRSCVRVDIDISCACGGLENEHCFFTAYLKYTKAGTPSATDSICIGTAPCCAADTPQPVIDGVFGLENWLAGTPITVVYALSGCSTPPTFTVDSTHLNCTAFSPNPGPSVQDNELLARHGNWQPKEQFTWVAERDISGMSGSLALATEGLLRKVVLFDYDSPFFVYADVAQNWVRSENMDMLGPASTPASSADAVDNRTSVLFGYQLDSMAEELTNLPVAVVTNARPDEVLFESFEDAAWQGTAAMMQQAGGNVTLSDDASTPRQETYTIVGGVTIGGDSVLIDKEYDAQDLPEQAGFLLQGAGGATFTVMAEVTGASAVSSANLPRFGASAIDTVTQLKINWPCTESGRWAGKVELVYCTPSAGGVGQASTSVAHTGTASFKPDMYFNRTQHAVNLIQGKRYTASCWLAVPGAVAASDFSSLGGIDLVDAGHARSLRASGPVIDGWQRFQLDFVASGGPVALQFPMGAWDFYVDDLRLCPTAGRMTSYVYDADRQLLVAQLDENNYATFYVYDDAGNLVLINKETERGIKTIQESRSFISANED